MLPDTSFLLAFSVLGLFICGVASIFITKTLKNFKEETEKITTDEERQTAIVALQRAKEKSNRFIAIGCAVVCAFAGATGLVVTSYQYSGTSAFLEKAEKTEGKIIRVEVQSTRPGMRNNSSVAYYPKFTFQTRTGEIIETLSSTGVSSAAYYHPGEAIPVLYDPSNPYDAKINTFFQLWASTLIFFAISLVFLIFPLGYGIYQIVKLRRRTTHSLGSA